MILTFVSVAWLFFISIGLASVLEEVCLKVLGISEQGMPRFWVAMFSFIPVLTFGLIHLQTYMAELPFWMSFIALLIGGVGFIFARRAVREATTT